MAIGSSKSKMTVKDLAGGQGNFVNSKHRKMKATNLELTKYGLSDIFIKE